MVLFCVPILVQQFSITFTMEDLDSRLFIADVEISCWQDQLRQAVSICFSPSSKSFFFLFGLSILIID